MKDQYGKLAEIEKEVDIKSTLRPKLFVSPLASVRGNPVNFVVKSNDNLASFAWDFGDGDTRTIQSNKINHSYSKV
ncbi:MAG: hypothetical protein GXP45_07515 [bacterium]|nr:hypothetical protein [bacterium]